MLTQSGVSSVVEDRSPSTIVRAEEPRVLTPAHPWRETRFMFATGIECSCPIVAGTHRMDQMQCCGHYEHWEKDLSLVKKMGINFLRYGPPYYKMHLAPGQYDWTFFDRVYARMEELGIEPMIDLVHFGLPDWMGNFQNPDFPKYLAEYALAFAQRYPRIKYYTPVNEIFITAQFSGAFGWWNEQLKGDHSFVTALTNCSKATLLAQQAILSVSPEVMFVHSESFEYFHPCAPQCAKQAHFLNERRFLSLDLIYKHRPSAEMCRYLGENGVADTQLDWFLSQDMRRHSVLGADYYYTNEHVLQPDGKFTRCGDMFGFYVVAKQYYDRYRLPIMHTETNRINSLAGDWMRKQWVNLLRLRDDGVPVIGFTWYSLTDQTDWDSALTQPRGHVNTLGLYDLKRQPRSAAKNFRRIIEDYAPLLKRAQHEVPHVLIG